MNIIFMLLHFSKVFNVYGFSSFRHQTFSTVPISHFCNKNSYQAQDQHWIKSTKRSQLFFSSEKFSQDEINTIENLIVDIAKEPTDESRRDRLFTVFTNQYTSATDDDVKESSFRRFATLFDETIIRMGQVVQTKAREKAAEQQRQQSLEEKTEESTEAPEKSQEEKELWAYVDMMIQSKALAKKMLN